MVEKEMVGMLLQRRNLLESSSSSSSSDLEWETALGERGKRKLRSRISGYADVVSSYMDHEFKSHFRMSRATFEYLLKTIQEDLTRKVKGCPTIPSRQQLLIALWKMATLDSYRSVCDRFNVGKATALRAVRRVTNALFRKSSQFIYWPSGDGVVTVMRGFEEASGFPRTIGAIDGTHIRINAPVKNPEDYINRKGYHSLQLQLVCDYRTLITHCFIGYPGSVHDQRVFRQSEVADFLNHEEMFPADSHIQGDASYELHRHLLTPFRNDGHLTERQKNYNHIHSSARIAIERCIGLVKGRWRSLLHCLPMSRLDLMAKYIVACCVLHNICTLRGDEIHVVTIPQPPNVIMANILHPAGRNGGSQKRNFIMNTLRNG